MWLMGWVLGTLNLLKDAPDGVVFAGNTARIDRLGVTLTPVVDAALNDW
jgi:hypothetical protein